MNICNYCQDHPPESQCPSCDKPVCNKCLFVDNNERPICCKTCCFKQCSYCLRHNILSGGMFYSCDKCGSIICESCYYNHFNSILYKCYGCDERFCSYCITDNAIHKECITLVCDDCYTEVHDFQDIKYCKICSALLCSNCYLIYHHTCSLVQENDLVNDLNNLMLNNK